VKIFENLDLQDLENETWKDILDYESDYQVSNIGRVKSFKKWRGINCRILKQIKNKKTGYFQIKLFENGRYETKRTHRLVYETFKEKLEEGYDAHHINEDKEDNYVENLESKPHSEHTGDHHIGKHHSNETRKKISKNHADISGKNNPNFEKYLYGENTSNHKLNNKKVIQIKMLFKLGFKNKEISNIYKVCEMTIYHIRIGKTWNHIRLEKT
jgi:hypothetical protein